MNETNSTGATSRRRVWLGRILFGLAGLVLLLAAFYLIATSSFFLKSVVLPRVGEAVHARVTVSDAALSPFSRLVLHDLKIEPGPGEPLLAVQEMRVRYSLMDILAGRIRVEEIAVVAPVVNLVVKADGSTNLDPLLSGGATKDSPPPTPSSGPPPDVDLRLLLITNATLRVSIERPAGGHERAEISGCNLALENVRNGQEARLGLAAAWKLDQTSAVTNLGAQGRFTAAFTLGLTAGLQPAAARGQGRLEIQDASGAAVAARGLAATLAVDATPTELKMLDARLEKGGGALAQCTVQGPFDAIRREGDLVVSMQGIGREALNLAGAAAGVDFGATTISTTNRLQLAHGGQVIAIGGEVSLSDLSLRQGTMQTPVLNLAGRYDFGFDARSQTATLRQWAVSGTQGGAPLLSAALDRPMTLALGSNATSLPDATLTLELTGLDLAAWRSVLGTPVEAGRVFARLNASTRESGRTVRAEMSARVDNARVAAGSQRFDDVAATLDVRAEAREWKHYRLDDVRLALAHRRQPLVRVAATGEFQPAPGLAKLQTTVEAALPGLLVLAGQTNTTLQAGDLRLTANLEQTSAEAGAARQHIAATLMLTNITGRLAEVAVERQSAAVELAAGRSNDIVEIERLRLALAPTPRATNQVVLTGRLDLGKTNAIQGHLRLAAESLDLTPYYDLVAGQPSPAKQPPATPPRTESEPAPVVTGLTNFVVETAVGRLYLREIEITNVQAGLRVDGSRVTARPLQLALNGAPVRGAADLDLGVAGYRYDVSLAADRVPLAPLANSFSPNYRGQARGDLLARIELKGAGVTGPSLRSNLAGQVALTFTNADIQVAGPKLKAFLTPIAAMLRTPELLGTPLHGADTALTASNGVVHVGKFELVSPAFTAATAGSLSLADALMASRIEKWPMTFALRRGLAEKVQLVPRDTPTNAAYARLPDFIRVAGTLAEPKPELTRDLKSLAGSALQLLGDKIPGVDKKTGDLLKNVGGLLSGSSTNQSGANATGTNPPPRFNPLDLLKRPQ